MKRLCLSLVFQICVLVLVACGDGPADDPSGSGNGNEHESAHPPAATPEGTFEAMKAATLADDWEGLFELNAPSEREECEARWDKAREDPEKEQAFGRLAGLIERKAADVRKMTLREYFVARNAYQAESPRIKIKEIAATAEFVGTEQENEKQGTLMSRFKTAEGEQQLPMKREDGRWYMFMVLSGLTRF